MLGAALSYNLKKLMKWNAPERISMFSQLEIPAILTKDGVFLTILRIRQYLHRHSTSNIFQPV